MKKPTPSACMNCNKRKPNCHSYCEDYILYSKELQEWKEQVIEEKKKYNAGYMKHDAKTRLLLEQGRYRKVTK